MAQMQEDYKFPKYSRSLLYKLDILRPMRNDPVHCEGTSLRENIDWDEMGAFLYGQDWVEEMHAEYIEGRDKWFAGALYFLEGTPESTTKEWKDFVKQFESLDKEGEKVE